MPPRVCPCSSRPPPCRYYPGLDLQDDISTETERVKFLQSVAQVMLTKARMKLNIKKLYSADGLAVKELLKVASLLYKATSTATNVDEVWGVEWWGGGRKAVSCTRCAVWCGVGARGRCRAAPTHSRGSVVFRWRFSLILIV